MGIHSIELTRTGYGKTTVNVEADTRKEAAEAALERAGDLIYTEYASDYSCDDLPPIDDEARHKTSLERIASIIGLGFEDTPEGHAALLGRASAIHSIMVSVAANEPLVVERSPMGKGWCIRLGSSTFVTEDLVTEHKPYWEEKLEDAIELAHAWVNKYMDEGVAFGKACLAPLLEKDEYALGIGESDEGCYSDEIPGPKPTIFVYLRGDLTDEIRARGPKGHWRFVYRPRSLPAAVAPARKRPLKTFIRVEYDPKYSGGDYEGVGSFALIPATEKNIEAAFSRQVGLPASCIIHYSPDELYDEDGELAYA